MLGISYGEIFLLLGATVAFIGPKDLPIIARTAGRLAGRSIGYVQMARGQFEGVMQKSEIQEVKKELQDMMAQMESIKQGAFINRGSFTTRVVQNRPSQPHATNGEKENSKYPQDSTFKLETTDTTTIADLHQALQDLKARVEAMGDEVRSIRSMNSGPSGTRLVDNIDTQPHATNVRVETTETTTMAKDHSSSTSLLSDMHSKATAYARLAESTPLTANPMEEALSQLKDDSGLFVVLPISAESAKLLPSRKDDLSGSDILLEALLEEDVAHSAKGFFSQAPDQLKNE